MLETLVEWSFWPVTEPTASVIIRWVFAIAMLPYGITKLMNPQRADKFPKVLFFSPKMGYFSSALIEVIVPCCLIFGFLTRFAVIPAIVSFAVATKVSYEDTFHTSPAFPFLLGMIAILIIGSGNYSVDYWLMQCFVGK